MKSCWMYAIAALAAAGSVGAAYPERPIRLIISSAPGASSDVVSRILVAELAKQMGQQIIVDNRPAAAIVTKLNAEVNTALQSPALRSRYAEIEAEPVGGTPEQFAAYVKKEAVKWAEVVRKSGAKLD